MGNPYLNSKTILFDSQSNPPTCSKYSNPQSYQKQGISVTFKAVPLLVYNTALWECLKHSIGLT